ncbi:hypothetical protein TNCV_4347531 [Trichonephila clavipes]|nr:hypothetical protein TNCV_4347531 [Trichonephila clavipes]
MAPNISLLCHNLCNRRMLLNNRCLGHLSTPMRWSSALRQNQDSSLKITRLQSVTLQLARSQKKKLPLFEKEERTEETFL